MGVLAFGCLGFRWLSLGFRMGGGPGFGSPGFRGVWFPGLKLNPSYADPVGFRAKSGPSEGGSTGLTRPPILAYIEQHVLNSSIRVVR
jgi:hypothetical protein